MEGIEYISTTDFTESWFKTRYTEPEGEIPTKVHNQSAICEICERRFRFPSQLEDHMLIHKQVRNFVCEVCGMRFLRPHHLKAHSVTHSTIKQHMCPVCGRRFSLKANMQRHLRLHDGGSSFKCEQCGKIFAHAQTLKMHINAHLVGKQYFCEICGKSFSRAHTLGGHMSIHDSNKAHVCEACGKSFTLRENLRRHQRDKHGAVIPTLLSRDYAVLASPIEISQVLNKDQADEANPFKIMCAKQVKESTRKISPPHIVYISHLPSCSDDSAENNVPAQNLL